MAGSVNSVTILGTLGRDPEVRTTQSGTKIVNLSVATSESWNDKQTGERKQVTEWHKIVIMNDRLGDVAEKYLKKGNKVYLEGKLQTRKWTDKDGVDRYSTEIMLGLFHSTLVLLEKNGDGEGGGGRPSSKPASRAAETRQDNGYDDEIPF